MLPANHRIDIAVPAMFLLRSCGEEQNSLDPAVHRARSIASSIEQAGEFMIIYEPCELTRNERTVQALKDEAGVRPLSPADRIKRATAEIVSAMIEIHGGECG